MPRLVRDRLTWLIYVQLGLYAYFLYGFGPVVGFLRDEQGTSNALASLHSSALAVGAMLGGAAFAATSRRLGRGRVMWVALAIIAVAISGFVLLPAWYPLTLGLVGVISFGGMWVVSCVVTTLTEMHAEAGPAAISEANAFAVGAGLISPLVIGLAVEVGLGWRAGVAVVIGMIGLVALAAWRLRITSPARPEPVAVEHRVARVPLPQAYWLAWTMLVMTGAVEIGLSLWTAIVLRERLDFSPAAASAAVSAVVGGMFAGRTVGAPLSLRFRALTLYFASLGVSVIGFAVFWLAPGATTAVVGLFILGLGNAMHYPLAIAMAIGMAPDPDRAAGISSYGMGLSFGVAPFGLGLLADSVGTHAALLMVPVLLAIAALLAWRLRRLTDAPKLDDRAVEVVQQLA